MFSSFFFLRREDHQFVIRTVMSANNIGGEFSELGNPVRRPILKMSMISHANFTAAEANKLPLSNELNSLFNPYE